LIGNPNGYLKLFGKYKPYLALLAYFDTILLCNHSNQREIG
jgi:hypothetical protein